MFESTRVFERARSFSAEVSWAWSWAFLALALVERGLEQPRIDLRQHVALLDVLAFGEQHLLQLAVDLGMNGHGERRLHGPQPGQ
jgi:hypothetical protein